MATVTRHHLLAAMRAGKAFDGAAFVPDNSGFATFSPPILQASFEMPNPRGDLQREVIESFEQRSNEARTAMTTASKQFTLPTLTPAELIAAIAIAIVEIEGLPPAHRAARRLTMRAGLQIIGVCITDGASPEHPSSPIRLSNARLPFSLRLIGCVVKAPLAMSNCELVTLDLSGSSLAGLDASFLKASGSVRLRRAYMQAPADFGGARIHGYFDATDLTMKPFGSCPQNQAFDGDRGMLNLSEATIDNDIRLERAVIWGGLAMRGLKTQRTIFLNEAVLLSPLAVLEAMAAEEIRNDRSTGHLIWQTGQSPTELGQFPTLAKPETYCAGRKRLAELLLSHGTHEFAAGGPAVWRISTLDGLITDTLRVRTSAVRADGIQVGGSIFARAIVCHGRLRMKYAAVAGGMSLAGSRLRSNEAVRRMFDDIYGAEQKVTLRVRMIEAYRRATYAITVQESDLVSDTIATGADDFALDIRESRFGGTVRIGASPKEAGKPDDSTCIDGVVAADRAHIDGELHFARANFRWAIRVNEKQPAADQQYAKTDSYADKAKKCADSHFEKIRLGQLFAINLGNITVLDSVTFDGSSGVCGVNLQNAKISGDISFFEAIRIAPSTFFYSVSVANSARRPSGQIKFAGAEVAGDCRLVFDRSNGPSIDGEFAKIAGELEIAPLVAPDGTNKNIVTLDPDVFDKDVKASDAAWRAAQIEAHAGPAAWETWIARQKAHPKIDLRNARATAFAHMPAAWPHFGRLEIIGFRYDRGKGHGPLAPHPSKLDSDGRSLTSWLVAAVLALVAVELLINMADGNLDTFGGNVGWLALLCFVAAADVLLPEIWQPLRSQSRPMAIPYLNLQRVEINRYRTRTSLSALWQFALSTTVQSVGRILAWGLGAQPKATPKPRRGNIYHALEPYVAAAKALREEGRWLSGNLVEERRLHVRTGQLSWRLHLFAKASFNIAHITVRYGFSYVRLGYMTVALVLLAGLVGEHGVNTRALVPDGNKVAFDAALGSGDIGEIRKISQSRPLVCELATKAEIEKMNGNCSRFSALAYGIDAVVPTISMGEMEKWEFQPEAKGPFRIGPWTPGYKTLILTARLIGLALVGLLIIGITSRLGTLIGRYRD
ncbi:MAG: hypothetical protein ACOYLS_11560 [Polymorphobacter sp.]